MIVKRMLQIVPAVDWYYSWEDTEDIDDNRKSAISYSPLTLFALIEDTDGIQRIVAYDEDIDDNDSPVQSLDNFIKIVHKSQVPEDQL